MRNLKSTYGSKSSILVFAATLAFWILAAEDIRADGQSDRCNLWIAEYSGTDYEGRHWWNSIGSTEILKSNISSLDLQKCPAKSTAEGCPPILCYDRSNTVIRCSQSTLAKLSVGIKPFQVVSLKCGARELAVGFDLESQALMLDDVVIKYHVDKRFRRTIFGRPVGKVFVEPVLESKGLLVIPNTIDLKPLLVGP